MRAQSARARGAGDRGQRCLSSALAALARLGLLLLGAVLAAGPAHAATFLVDSTGDAGDAAPEGTCDSAPGPPVACTLREAIQEANWLGGGPHNINFGIGVGPQTIVLGSALPFISSVVIIDGTTQPGFVAAAPFAPIIELSAAACGAVAALDLRAGSSGSTIRGLVINRCPNLGIRVLGQSNCVIAGNFLGTDLAGTAPLGNRVGVYIGGSASAANNNRVGGTNGGVDDSDRNIISSNSQDGIQINAGSGGAANNVVENNYIGVDVNGTAGLGNGSQGVAVFTGFANTNNVIGGTAANAGNLISGNGNDGVLIGNAGTTGTLVQGNFIGTNAAGTAAIPNGRGVEIDVSASGNTIGGAAAGAGNVISGNTTQGVFIHAASNNNTIQQNIIGRNATNTGAVANGSGGVRIENSSGNAIGGTGANDGNIIGGNAGGGDGVAILGGATGNAILRNSIFSNGGLGIDLEDDFVTANDVGDGDVGANNLQNTAVLSAVATDGAGNVHIAGSLNAVPGVATYRVEFFAHTSPDPSGHGEALRYLGFQDVTTDATGNGIIGLTLAAVVNAPADYVTTTVTDASNNTSEIKCRGATSRAGFIRRAASTGSACSSASLEASHVLLAMGLAHEQAHASLRFSMGKWTDGEHVDRVLEVLPAIVAKLRAMSPLLKSRR